MRTKTFALAGLCSILLALAAAATGAAATPSSLHTFHFTTAPFASNLCGIEGIDSITASGVYLLETNGAILNSFELASVFTDTATGKSILFQSAQGEQQAAPIDNGDSTISFLNTESGLNKISLPNGPPLTIDAGQTSFLVTFDATTGDFISFQLLSSAGLHPSSNACDLILAALA
jgi:hypothetical protein